MQFTTAEIIMFAMNAVVLVVLLYIYTEFNKMVGAQNARISKLSTVVAEGFSPAQRLSMYEAMGDRSEKYGGSGILSSAQAAEYTKLRAGKGGRGVVTNARGDFNAGFLPNSTKDKAANVTITQTVADTSVLPAQTQDGRPEVLTAATAKNPRANPLTDALPLSIGNVERTDVAVDKTEGFKRRAMH